MKGTAKTGTPRALSRIIGVPTPTRYHPPGGDVAGPASMFLSPWHVHSVRLN